jgi:alpha-tubulin suppressor-like RCC1 family protein
VVSLVATPDTDYRFINWTGDVGTVGNVTAATTTITMDADYSITANFEEYAPMVAAGGTHTVALESDGTVVAVGLNNYGQCSVGNWTDIVQVAAALACTVGLKSDGTVVAAGPDVELAKWDLF